MCADAPDQSGMNAAALANANLSKETLDFYKQTYAEGAPAREAASTAAMRASNQAFDSMEQNNALAKSYADYNAGTFRPLEQSIVAGAQNYDSQANTDKKIGQSLADVSKQFAEAKGTAARDTARYGGDANSVRAQAMRNNFGMAEAAAKASASTAARNNIETQGYARKMDAANLGRNLASNQATSAGVSLNAGNSAVNNAQVPLTVASNAASQMGNGFSAAGNLNSSAGSLYNSAANIQNQASSSNDAMMGMLGSVAGKIAYSDVRLKTQIRGMNPDAALRAVTRTPVSNWQYKRGSVADDGGRRHTGPMAQDVQREMGNNAAPGGTTIDLISMNGVTMAAIQALNKKVDRLASQRGMRARA